MMKRLSLLLFFICALYVSRAYADQVVQLNVYRDSTVQPGQTFIVRVEPSMGVSEELVIPRCGNFSDAWWFTDALNTSEWTITVRNETCFLAICQNKVRFPLPPRYSANPNVPGAPGEPGVPLEKNIFVKIGTLPNGRVVCSITTIKD